MTQIEPTDTTTVRSGYTLVEVVMAMLLLGLVLVGLSSSLSRTMDTSYERHYYTVAQSLATNQVERLLAAGPRAATSGAIDTFTVTADGVSNPNGNYTVAVDTALDCAGGRDLGDNSLDTHVIQAGCSGDWATLTYTVVVRYAGRGPDQDPVRIQRSATLGERAHFTGIEARP